MALTVGLLVTVVLAMAFVVAAGHIAITKIFPKLKILLKAVIKDEEALNSLMYIFVIYVGLFVLSKLLELFKSFGVGFVDSMVNMVEPGVGILMSLLPYLQWLILGVFVIVGLRTFKK